MGPRGAANRLLPCDAASLVREPGGSAAGWGGQAHKKHGFSEPVKASLGVSQDRSAEMWRLWDAGEGGLKEILLSPQATSVPIIHTCAPHVTRRGIYREPGSPHPVGHAPSCVVLRAM